MQFKQKRKALETFRVSHEKQILKVAGSISKMRMRFL